MGEGSVPGKPRRVLLGYITFMPNEMFWGDMLLPSTSREKKNELQ